MDLLTVLVVLIIVGIVLLLINRFVPMDAKIKTILNWVVVIFIIIWFLKALGAFDALSRIHI